MKYTFGHLNFQFATVEGFHTKGWTNFFSGQISTFNYYYVYSIAGIVTFQKSNICPNKLLETSDLFNKIHFNSSNFQQISALEPNFNHIKYNQ
jgi:hypothetical protein